MTRLAVCILLAAGACGSHDGPPPATRNTTTTTPTPAPTPTPPTTATTTMAPNPTTPPPPTAKVQGAKTRDEAYALALAAVKAQHPGTAFTLREETQGGGLNGPWVFMITPQSTAPGDQIPGLGPMLVQYGSSDVIALRPHPKGLRFAVNEWEIATYGHLQR